MPFECCRISMTSVVQFQYSLRPIFGTQNQEGFFLTVTRFRGNLTVTKIDFIFLKTSLFKNIGLGEELLVLIFLITSIFEFLYLVKMDPHSSISFFSKFPLNLVTFRQKSSSFCIPNIVNPQLKSCYCRTYQREGWLSAKCT